MYICVDFDGTLVDHCYPEIGEPVPGAIPWLIKLQDYGAKLILFTMRSDSGPHGPVLAGAVEYLEKNGINLYGINHNPDQDSWTSSPKAYGHAYVDDAAVGCPLLHPRGFKRPCVDWAEVGPLLLRICQQLA